jgi:two-component system LytT family response regulator
LARNELKELIKNHPEIEIIGEAENVDLGFELINNTQPDFFFSTSTCLKRWFCLA